MATAMNYGVSSINQNVYEGNRIVVDVSGDGADSVAGYQNPTATNVQSARDNLVSLASVDMINALWIDDRNFFGDDDTDTINALLYGQTNVIYGSGSFSWVVDDFTEFQLAVRNKILTEIRPEVPEPTTMLLFGTGLVGLAALGRRKTRA
jgi:hypothetical protein